MLTGFVVAIIVGLIGAATVAVKQGHEKKFLQILNTMGPASARQFLDSKFKPATKIDGNRMHDVRRRLAGLALLGDHRALESEMQMHVGAVAVITQVNVLGVLGLAVRAPDPTPYVQRIEALANQIETQAGALYKIPKRQLRQLAMVGGAMVGRPMSPDDATQVFTVARQTGTLAGLVYYQALALAFERTGNGQKAAEMHGLVRGRTGAFDRQLAA